LSRLASANIVGRDLGIIYSWFFGGMNGDGIKE